MGYDVVEISARLSRHNSEQDEEDNLAWQQLRAEIDEIVRRPVYARMLAMVQG